MSAKEASASREAARLLHLRQDDCSALRAQLVQMEADWRKLTSDLSNTQEQLQQVTTSPEIKKTNQKVGLSFINPELTSVWGPSIWKRSVS